MPTPDGDGDEDFEFLVNLLASDGVDPDPLPPLQVTGSHKVDPGLRIQRGLDGRLDLGEVKTFYEKKNNVGVGAGTGIGGRDNNPGLADPRHHRNHSGRGGGSDAELAAFEGDITVSRSVSDRDDQTGTLSRQPLTPASCSPETRGNPQGRTRAPASPPSTDNPGKWVDLLSEREAKQLLLEISGALKLKLPPDDGPGSASDRPRTLGEVKNVVEFLAEMDELVWRRSEYGADRGVFDSKNISAVEEHIRLWERVAREPSSE